MTTKKNLVPNRESFPKKKRKNINVGGGEEVQNK